CIYFQVDAFILTYAVNERASYENVYLKWAPELRRFSPKAKIILAGTKTDLRTNSPKHVRTEEGEKLAKNIGAHGFIENSSKIQKNIDSTFEMAILAAITDKNFIKKKRKVECWIL
ncbi:hypothetical protein NQ317_015383, partial [Molorchus minor]